jgi:hypothetical protein
MRAIWFLSVLYISKLKALIVEVKRPWRGQNRDKSVVYISRWQIEVWSARKDVHVSVACHFKNQRVTLNPYTPLSNSPAFRDHYRVQIKCKISIDRRL